MKKELWEVIMDVIGIILLLGIVTSIIRLAAFWLDN
jgi:hypothetical protein